VRIRSIAVEGIRSFRQRREFDFSSETVNVLHGPNGSGKSTLLSALHLAFLTGHDSSAAQVAALVPWGTDLGPSVEVGFIAGDVELRLKKQFLHDRSCLLERFDGATWLPVAKGKQADARLREFLGAAADGKATSDRLLASVLWAQQGGLALSDVSGNVQSALSQQLDSNAAQQLRKWIDDRAGAYWTPTSRVQKHSPAAHLEAEDAALQSRQAGLRAELAAINSLRDEIVQLERAQSEAETTSIRLKSELDQLVKDSSAFESLRQQIGSLAPLAAAKAKEVNLVSSAVQVLAAAQAELATLLPRQAALESEAGPDLEARLAGTVSQLAGLNDQLVAAHAFAALHGELDSVNTRLAKMRQSQASIAGLEGELRGLNAPSSEQVARMNSLVNQLAQLGAKLDSALLHMDVRGERPVSIEIIEGDQAGEHTLDQDTPLRFTGSPKLRFRIAGVGEFSISGPASSASKLRQEIEQTKSAHDQLAASLGSSDLNELQRRQSRSSAIEVELRSLRSALAQESAGRTEIEWQQEAMRISVALERHYDRQPDWRRQSPDPETIQAAIAPLQATASALGALKEKLTVVRHALDSATERSNGVLTQQQVKSLDELKENESRLRTELAGLNAKLSSFETELAAYPPQLGETVQLKAAGLADATEGLKKTAAELQMRMGQLDEKLARAPASDLGEVEAAMSALETELDRERLQAQAWRLLRETAAECREQLLKGISGPAGERATAILKELGAGKLGGVRLAANLEPAPLMPPGAAAPVGLDLVSGGEAEQVHFAVRLALAEMIAKSEPQLVVFDDVLLSTDDERLARMLSLLEAASPHLQVLILTCHPERYEARLAKANMIGL
jgi:DNA repair exonuclease SbcCD ATPase subunit